MPLFAEITRLKADLNALRPLAPEQKQRVLQKFRRQRHHPQARPTRRAFFAAGAAGAGPGQRTDAPGSARPWASWQMGHPLISVWSRHRRTGSGPGA